MTTTGKLAAAAKSLTGVELVDDMANGREILREKQDQPI